MPNIFLTLHWQTNKTDHNSNPSSCTFVQITGCCFGWYCLSCWCFWVVSLCALLVRSVFCWFCFWLGASMVSFWCCLTINWHVCDYGGSMLKCISSFHCFRWLLHGYLSFGFVWGHETCKVFILLDCLAFLNVCCSRHVCSLSAVHVCILMLTRLSMVFAHWTWLVRGCVWCISYVSVRKQRLCVCVCACVWESVCRPLASKQQKLPFVPADVFMNKICDWLLQKLFRLTFLTLSKGRQEELLVCAVVDFCTGKTEHWHPRGVENVPYEGGSKTPFLGGVSFARFPGNPLFFYPPMASSETREGDPPKKPHTQIKTVCTNSLRKFFCLSSAYFKGKRGDNLLPRPFCRNVSEDFCCINFGGFLRGFSWGTFSHKNEEKKSGEKIRRPENKNPRKIRSAKTRPYNLYKLSQNCLRKLFVQTVFIWVGVFFFGWVAFRHDLRPVLVARAIRNAIRANRFARIIRNWNPYFYSASGRFA